MGVNSKKKKIFVQRRILDTCKRRVDLLIMSSKHAPQSSAVAMNSRTRILVRR